MWEIQQMDLLLKGMSVRNEFVFAWFFLGQEQSDIKVSAWKRPNTFATEHLTTLILFSFKFSKWEIAASVENAL